MLSTKGVVEFRHHYFGQDGGVFLQFVGILHEFEVRATCSGSKPEKKWMAVRTSSSGSEPGKKWMAILTFEVLRKI